MKAALSLSPLLLLFFTTSYLNPSHVGAEVQYTRFRSAKASVFKKRQKRRGNRFALLYADSGRVVPGYRRLGRRFRLKLKKTGPGPFLLSVRNTRASREKQRLHFPIKRTTIEAPGVSFTFSKPGKYWVTIYVDELRRTFQFRVNVVGTLPTPKEEPESDNSIPITPFPTPSPTPIDKPKVALPSLPNRAGWENEMQEYGALHCNEAKIQQYSTWEGSVWYYDGARVYYQIADYTGDTSWYRCAEYVNTLYRNYVESGKTPGWRVFPHGLAEHYWRTGSERSKQAVFSLANNSVFAHSGGSSNVEYSRETAYLIHAYLIAEELGAGEHPLLETSVNNALGHLLDWSERRATTTKPFMMALTFEALIHYYQKKNDSRIPTAIRNAADWLRESSGLYHAGTGGFDYALEARTEALDLNMLIAPVFGWLFQQTGNTKYITYGDTLFQTGQAAAWLKGGKQFSQNYRWSFDYVKWRTAPTP